MIQKARGTKDYFLEDKAIFDNIVAILDEVSRQYNFSKITTPTFESLDLYVRSVGESSDIVQKEMYVFNDKSNRKLVLRPEATAGIVRAYIESMQDRKLPLRFAYSMNMFRYENIQKGRQREFNQYGVEIIGSKKAIADFECIEMAVFMLKKLGLDKNIKVKINSLGSVEARKIFKEKLKEYMSENEALYCEDCHRRMKTNILRVLDCKEPMCKVISASGPKLMDYLDEESKEHLEELKAYLDSSSIVEEYEIDPYLVRGLDYYTRTVFEIVDKTGLTLIGGGRYDGLIKELGGNDTPATGFALGIERIKALYEEKLLEQEKEKIYNAPDFFIIADLDLDTTIIANRFAEVLRLKGFSVTREIVSSRFKSQFKTADKSRAKKSLIIGRNELKEGKVKVKDMVTGIENPMRIEEFLLSADINPKEIKWLEKVYSQFK